MTKDEATTSPKDAALKLALDLAIMHHSDDGYAELRSKVRQLAKEALALTSTPCEVQDELCSSQEPVAWTVVGDGKFGEYVLGQTFVDYEASHIYWENRGYELVPVYTTPTKAPVGKTLGFLDG